MSRIIYHYDSGTYFDLDDEVYVVDTTDLEGNDDVDELLDAYGKEIAEGFGELVVGYTAEVALGGATDVYAVSDD